jgi:uncharacterized protein
MNILVTGSSGLIGTALVERLLAGHHSVTRLVRPDSPWRAHTMDVTWEPSRGTIDLANLEQAGPFDGVVNLAGAGIGDKRWSADRKTVLLQSRVDATRLLVDTLGRLPSRPPVLVNASAVGFYGDRGDETLNEASAVGRGFLASLCQAWEGAAQPATERGIRTISLRSGFVISGRGGALGKQLPLFRMGLGGRLGRGTQYRSWIGLADEVGVILHCLVDDGLHGPVNATAPDPATDADLARALGAALHRPAVLAVPPVALRLALGKEMADELVLSGQRVIPAALEARGYRFVQTDLGESVRSALAAPR